MKKIFKKLKPSLVVAAFLALVNLVMLGLDRYLLGQESDELFLESKAKYLEAYKAHDCYTELEKHFAQIHEDAIEKAVHHVYIFGRRTPGDNASTVDEEVYTKNIEKNLRKLCK